MKPFGYLKRVIVTPAVYPHFIAFQWLAGCLGVWMDGEWLEVWVSGWMVDVWMLGGCGLQYHGQCPELCLEARPRMAPCCGHGSFTSM